MSIDTDFVRKCHAEYAQELKERQAWIDAHWGRGLPPGVGVVPAKYRTMKAWVESPEYDEWMRGGK